MENANLKEFIIVVHGTWNPPEEGKLKWFQFDDSDSRNFCNQLNIQLDKLGKKNTLWQDNQNKYDFSWSGENNHEARINASKSLLSIIKEIKKTKRIRLFICSP